MTLADSSRFQFTPDLTICRLLNGMWQVSGAHGYIEPAGAIAEMFEYHDAGLTTWDLADHYGPAEDFIGNFRRQFVARRGVERLSEIQAFTKWVPAPGRMTRRVVDEAIAALCAEAVGAMAVMHELTVDYLKTRRQLGREIGSFQVLQHRAVDMLVALEQARSMAMLATMMAAEDNAAERRNALAAAKVQIGRSGKFVGQQSIQLHGGIGMTMEYKVGHYFKRVTMIDTSFGDADHHLRELARRRGTPVPAAA